MQYKRLMILTTLFLLISGILTVLGQETEKKETPKDSTKTKSEKKEKKKKKLPGKPFEELIEHYDVIAGFFTLYQNKDDGKV